jgi:hypothetical protein
MELLGKPTIEFCERAGTGLIKRPFYATSNLAYLFVSFLILSKKSKLSRLFGYTALLCGLASFIYDASYTYLSQLVDLCAMLVFINLLIYLSAKRLFYFSRSKIILAQIASTLVGMYAIIAFKSYAGDYVFGFFVLLEIILEILLWKKGKSKKIKTWLSGLALFISGFAIWLLDASHLLCDPHNIVNGRSIFHLLTAGTIYLMYIYFEAQD